MPPPPHNAPIAQAAPKATRPPEEDESAVPYQLSRDQRLVGLRVLRKRLLRFLPLPREFPQQLGQQTSRAPWTNAARALGQRMPGMPQADSDSQTMTLNQRLGPKTQGLEQRMPRMPQEKK